MKKDWFSKEVTIEVVVGTFMVSVLLGMAYFTILLSRETWFSRQQTMEVMFRDVMGLREGDGVVVRGMTVGKVKALDLRKDCVCVHIKFDADHTVALKKDHEITIISTSILGGRHLQINAGSPDMALLSEDSVIHGKEPYDIMSDVAAIMNKARKSVVEDGMIDDIRRTVAIFKEVAENVHGGKGVIGGLLAENSTMMGDLTATVASVRKTTERLEKGEGMLGKLLSQDDTVYRDLQSAVASFKNVAEKVDKGEGLIGKLISDDTLYNEIEGTVKEIRAAVDDFRETAPVVTFTSVFFGAF